MLEELWVNVQETLLTIYRAFQELSPLKRFLVVFFIIAIIPGYFLSKTVAHSFWQSSYKDSYIIARPSFTNPRPVSAGEVTVLSTGGGIFSAYAEIKNDNLELVAKTVPYTFRFFNQQGQQVYSTSGSTFLTLDQKKYLVVPRFSSGEQISKGSLEIGDVSWQKRFVVPEISLLVNTPLTTNELDPLAFVVQGQIHNNSPYNLGAVRLILLLENASGSIVAVTVRDEYSLKPNERRAYKVIWPGIYSTAIARVRVLPETNPLDNSNLGFEQEGQGGDLQRLKLK